MNFKLDFQNKKLAFSERLIFLPLILKKKLGGKNQSAPLEAILAEKWFLKLGSFKVGEKWFCKLGFFFQLISEWNLVSSNLPKILDRFLPSNFILRLIDLWSEFKSWTNSYKQCLLAKTVGLTLKREKSWSDSFLSEEAS